MRCRVCGSELSARKRFCGECGAPQSLSCVRCGAELVPRHRFCGDCGAPADSATPAGLPATPTAPPFAVGPGDGERRHLTVLFSDLLGSTEIAARLDPEEWRDIVARYHAAAAEAVERLGGHVAQYLGDGVMVYFGWPTAHEDDAERAVRAGLAIIEAMAGLNGRFGDDHGVTLSVRIGIDSGSVVVGGGGGAEASVFGDTPNIAARVQSLANPDAVVMTGAVHDLVQDRFAVEDLGAHALKGITRPIQLYRAIRPSAGRRGWRRSTARGLTPFINREGEKQLLLSRWERAVEGEGQLVLLRGEPGIGKSRLMEEFRVHIRGKDHLWIHCAGERFFGQTPFHVVSQLIEQALGWSDEAVGERRVDELERSLAQTGAKLDQALPLIAEMLNLAVPERYPPLDLEPDEKRRRLLATLVTWVLDLARLQPLVVAMEDLHWVDPSTLELARMLVGQAATAPLLLLFTARPEYRPPWPMRAYCAEITLSRLSDQQTRALITGVVARWALTSEVIDTLVRRTDGVPLFAEELTRLVVEGGPRPTEGDIPATLRDSLTARLDRLGPAREVAQVAAVIGREFSYALLEAVLPPSDLALAAALETLASDDLIHVRGFPPDSTYQFRHALTQDAAYESLLKSRRRELHLRIASVISERFPAMAEAQPQVLARHWTQAGEAELSVAAWMTAADRAYGRQAFREAEDSYDRARNALGALPPSSERDSRELGISSVLVRVMQMTQGYAAPKTVEIGARVRELAEKTGHLTELLRQEARTWAAVLAAGDYGGAAAVADRLLEIASRRHDNREHLVLAEHAQVQSRFYLGDLIGAEAHFARLSELIEVGGARQPPDVTTITIGLAALCAWWTGRVQLARDRIGQAIAFATRSARPYDMAMAHLFEGYLAVGARDPEGARAAATRMLALAEKHDFAYAHDLANGVLGWALAYLGQPEEGVALIRVAADRLIRGGGRLGHADLLNRLADAQDRAGATMDALASIEAAINENPDGRTHLTNALKRRGDLRLALGQTAQAEADFRRSLAMAESLGARLMTLRAITALAQILGARGEAKAGRDLLRPAVEEIAPDFAGADLDDARALLTSLEE